ncbi:MAG: multicopper oxidase family protein [Rhodoferax sp.]
MKSESNATRRAALAALTLTPTLIAARAWAQGMDHSAHGMAGASPAAADPHAAHASAASEPVALAPVDTLPAGQPLATLPRLENRSRKGGLFSATLTAAPMHLSLVPGTTTEFWAYNGELPGPLIEAREGDTVEILFKNRLPQPSTIHWHGLPVPPEHDGNPQDPVAPGAQRLYRFVLPKGCAGTYWYHPHPHGYTAEQVFRGLAGLFIVRAAHDPLAGIPERHWVFSDLKLAADGRIPPNDDNDTMNGREGQFSLVNGQRQPQVRFAAGGRERWRIWNANSARYLRLQLGDVPFTLVGTDGGLLQAPRPGLTELLLAPAERVEVIVDAPAQPGRRTLISAVYARGKMGKVAPDTPLTLAQVDFAAPPRKALPPLPTHLRRIDDLGPAVARQRVVFSEEMSMAGGVHRMKFLINGGQFDMNRVDLHGRLGEVELWEVVNQADMDHPFHIHGVQFQEVERVFEGQTTPAPYRAWKDIANLRAGETVRLKLRQMHPGLRMFHCHILEHENAGMMGQVLVG